MAEFTVIIPHRGNALGLWATVHSIEEELSHGNYDYNYAILTNGEDKLQPDAYNVIHWLKRTNKVAFYQHMEEPLTPPMARMICAGMVNSEYLFFFDNHCLVARNYFDIAFRDFREYGMDLLHSCFRYYSGEATHYHYKLELERNFWAHSEMAPKYADRPYPIAASGHGGWAIRHDVFDEVGGYWTGFKGYGGEETYFDLKMWMLGKTVWADPNLIHYHFAGNRGYDRHYTDEFYTNMLCSANIIGGEEWLYKVYQSFENNWPKVKNDKTFFDLMTIAQERSRERAEWLAARRIRTLDETLAFFKANDIAC